MRKGQGFPAYSGFEGVNADGRSLRDILEAANITDVDVVGLAFDYCVKATSIDATLAGLSARVLRDLAAAIHQDGSADAAMTAAGVTIMDSTGESLV